MAIARLLLITLYCAMQTRLCARILHSLFDYLLELIIAVSVLREHLRPFTLIKYIYCAQTLIMTFIALYPAASASIDCGTLFFHFHLILFSSI